MSGAVMNYDFGPKRNWRRWVWNRIAERVENTRTSTVLYLAGAQDFDRAVALRHGFAPNNLIAAERHAPTLGNLRSSGVLAVDGEFKDVLNSLIASRPVHVVYGDFCNGLTLDLVHSTVNWIGEPKLRKSAFAFNMLLAEEFVHAKCPKGGQVEHQHRSAMLCRPDWIAILRAGHLASGDQPRKNDGAGKNNPRANGTGDINV